MIALFVLFLIKFYPEPKPKTDKEERMAEKDIMG